MVDDETSLWSDKFGDASQNSSKAMASVQYYSVDGGGKFNRLRDNGHSLSHCSTEICSRSDSS